LENGVPFIFVSNGCQKVGVEHWTGSDTMHMIIKNNLKDDPYSTIYHVWNADRKKTMYRRLNVCTGTFFFVISRFTK
jgi:hypothetical protein